MAYSTSNLRNPNSEYIEKDSLASQKPWQELNSPDQKAKHQGYFFINNLITRHFTNVVVHPFYQHPNSVAMEKKPLMSLDSILQASLVLLASIFTVRAGSENKTMIDTNEPKRDLFQPHKDYLLPSAESDQQRGMVIPFFQG
ncbi:hypothetical protein PIB30_024870 [Stylosanthes scabra]|uniref:Uncharacterized protein n=1 Tax=Stylosanthes scabra TaxID=79078 RepID=A0ABU6Q9H7_9FABA|nr:hypothetical protein [Stylosanthes scabra]